jgi:hypothetical protein
MEGRKKAGRHSGRSGRKCTRQGTERIETRHVPMLTHLQQLVLCKFKQCVHLLLRSLEVFDRECVDGYAVNLQAEAEFEHLRQRKVTAVSPLGVK